MNRNGALTYRMKLDGFCWHYHKECDQYPQTNYKIITTNEIPEYMMICTKCKKLQEPIETKL